MAPQPVSSAIVIVPAHNEAARIPSALAAVASALDHLGKTHPQIRGRAVIALDRCTDGTRDIVAIHCARDTRFASVTGDFGSAGAARNAAAQRALGALPPGDPDHVWIACTDADSVVPPAWLQAQVNLADAGADVVAGAVDPNPAEIDPDLLAHWYRLHTDTLPATQHAPRDAAVPQHIFGANLGIRASTYLALGGFRGASAGEDRRLVEDAFRFGARIVTDPVPRVLTSARTEARAPGGFGEYLSRLAQASGHHARTG